MVTYDSYYKTEDYFGAAQPELVDFFAKQVRGRVLDAGCGQGRDSIAIARLGFDVVGMDISKVGIAQMLGQAEREGLQVSGLVTDVFAFDGYHGFDYVLFDSMFHFQAADRSKETELLRRIVHEMSPTAMLLVCIIDSGKKVRILKDIIDTSEQMEYVLESTFQYEWKDALTGLGSKSQYKLIAAKKI